MVKLNKKYLDRLSAIAEKIQNSDLLNKFLEEEEEEDYKALQQAFESEMEEVYTDVASEDPLQLYALETAMLEEKFEGLYLPRILGYAVLREEVSENYKYVRPNGHFRSILEAMIGSANFELLKLRTGQSIQIGFALSSDIWITNLMNEISNKRIKSWLTSLKLERFRYENERRIAYLKFRKQFKSLNFNSAKFPETAQELKASATKLKEFLVYRANNEFSNNSLMTPINNLVNNKDFVDYVEYMELLVTIGMFYELKGKDNEKLSQAFNHLRVEHHNFDEHFFRFLEELLSKEVAGKIEYDKRLSSIIDKSKGDELSKFYNLIDVLHTKGYIHEDGIDAVRKYYDNHEGLSIENRCLRMTILYYFDQFLSNLPVEDYPEYFEINKTFIQYINIFSNQKFNQSVKAMSLKYIKKLQKNFTDKRGKDYQDIKKFVNATFTDLGFMKPKELVELFKTKRKKKPVQ